MKILIIGAGPTGLAAATRLQSLGADWALHEKEPLPGGLSASFKSDGFTWDLGGHIVFSHYDSFSRMLDDVLDKDEWLSHERNAFIRCCERWVPYPFQNNIRCLPEQERDECLAGLRAVAGERESTAPADFQEWIDRMVGPGIARLFMNPYNYKVWAFPPVRLSAEWLGERVAKPDVERIAQSFDAEHQRDTWGPNSSFLFPATGGTGAIWQRLADRLPGDRLHYNCELVGIELDRKQVRFSNGNTVPYDRLITTMPLDQFAALTARRELAEPAERLMYNSVHVVGFGMQGDPPPDAINKSWLYFPERDDPFYRVTVFSNYSPGNAPEGHYSLMAEISESPMKDVNAGTLVEDCEHALRRARLIGPEHKVCHTWARRLPHAYPVPGLERDSILSNINDALEQEHVYSRGRFGAWKYEVGNMDHSFAQGIEIANRLVLDEPEITYNDPETVNAR